jgi:hypothetical protein
VLDTGPIETTPDHPFYTADRGWIVAGALQTGERIRTATGIDAVVVSFTIEQHPASMWDITVAGAHSFFVGSGAVLVHNCPNPLRFTGDQQALLTWPKVQDARDCLPRMLERCSIGLTNMVCQPRAATFTGGTTGSLGYGTFTLVVCTSQSLGSRDE